MTEEEAKTKWCPMAKSYFLPVEEYAELTRGMNEARLVSNNCIGSACMAWREIIMRKGDKATAACAPGVTFAVNEDVRVGGYCGLAGKLV